MALFHTQYTIDGHSTGVSLYAPNDLPAEVGNQLKGAIILLSGPDYTPGDWFTMTAACRYAADNGFMLIMPQISGPEEPAPGFAQKLLTALGGSFLLPQKAGQFHIAGVGNAGITALRQGICVPNTFLSIGLLDAPAAPQIPEGIKTAGKKRLLLCTREDDPPTEKQKALFNAAIAAGLDCQWQSWQGKPGWAYADIALTRFFGSILGKDYSARKTADWAAPVQIL